MDSHFPPFFSKYLSVWEQQNSDLKIKIESTTSLEFPERHRKITRQQAGKVSLDDEGYPLNHQGGTPFPSGRMIDTDTLEPPNMGEKLYWNLYYRPRSNLMDRHLEAVVQNAYGNARSSRLYDAALLTRHRTEAGPIHPEWAGKIYRKTLSRVLAPSSNKGIVTLLNLEDHGLTRSVNRYSYVYLPSRRSTMRRSLQQGCVALGQSDYYRDDQMGYSGPFDWMNYDYQGTTKLLVPFNIDPAKQDFHPVSNYRENATQGGIPNGANWQVRELHVLELTPRSGHSDYCYARKRLYIDVQSYMVHYYEIFDQSGNRWKFGIASARPMAWRNGQSWVASGWSAMFDLKNKHLTTNGNPDPYDTDVASTRQDFTRGALRSVTN